MDKYKQKILVDMDGVLADFDLHVFNILKHRFPEIPIPKSLNAYYFRNNFPEKHWEQIESIYLEKGFFESIPMIKDADKGIEYLVQQGCDVYICTRPLLRNPYSFEEKVTWVKTNLGEKMLEKLIICRDKTMIKGDYLIDDDVRLMNSIADWQLILFDRFEKQIEDNVIILKSWEHNEVEKIC